jgi:hypothetical protein
MITVPRSAAVLCVVTASAILLSAGTSAAGPEKCNDPTLDDSKIIIQCKDLLITADEAKFKKALKDHTKAHCANYKKRKGGPAMSAIKTENVERSENAARRVPPNVTGAHVSQRVGFTDANQLQDFFKALE